MSFVKTFGMSNTMRILDYFVYSQAPDIDVMNICRELKLSRKTVDKAMRILTQSGLIYASRRVGKSIMYKKNPKLTEFANLMAEPQEMKVA